ncbi:MAG: Ig-like domain-containing protein [Thermoanaerobaculia bacterium]
MGVLGGLLGWALAPAAWGALVLPDPGNEVYYTRAAAAGGELKVEQNGLITGNACANSNVELQPGSRIVGDLTTSGQFGGGGTVTGQVTTGAPPTLLPALGTEAQLRALANRVFNSSQVFTNAVIDDVVFVAGTVRFEGSLRGTGTVIARGEIRIKNLPGNTQDTLDPNTRLSLISLSNLRVDQNRRFRGLLRAAAEIEIEQGARLEGTVVAGSNLKLKRNATLTFLDLDPLGPTITLASPEPGSTITERRPAIVATFADDLSGVVASSVVFRLDGQTLTSAAQVSASGLSYTPPTPLATGPHEIYLAVADHSANTTDAQFHFTIAGTTQPPTLELHQPPDGAFFGRGTLTVAGELTTPGGFGALSLTLDGQAVAVSSLCTVGADFFRCSLPDPPPGSHTLNARLTDTGGQAATDLVTFELLGDTVAPTIAIVEPASPTWLNLEAPVVEVRFADALSGIAAETFALSLDGGAVVGCSLSESAARCALGPLAAGPHSLAASVRDLAGNLGQTTFQAQLVVDHELPQVAIETPARGADVNTATVLVTGTAADANGILSVAVNGVAATLSGSHWEATVPLSGERVTLLAEAVDGVGNHGFAYGVVDHVDDTVAPALVFEQPVAGSFVNEDRPSIVVRYGDDAGVAAESLRFTVAGEPVPVSCSFELIRARCRPDGPLAGGPVELAAEVTDRFGNRATAQVAFTIDPEPIVVAIDTPADRSITGEGHVAVAGHVSAGVTTVSINGVAAQLSGGQFSATVPLREGTNVLVALAVKSSGNTATASAEVTRDIVAPVVRIDSPHDGYVSATSRLTLAGVVNDVVDGAVPTQLTVNGISAAVDAGTFLVADLPLLPGENVLEAIATDAAGNEGRHQIRVSYQPPSGPHLSVVSGDHQFGQLLAELAEPLTVELADSLGLPLPGRLVRFRVSRGSGELRAAPGDEPARELQVPTDGAGRASVRFTLGEVIGVGNSRVSASVLGVEGEVELYATALPIGPERVLMSMGDNQQGEVGQPLPRAFDALVADRFGNPIAGIPVTFTVVTGGGRLGGGGESLVRVSDGKGIARAVLTLGNEAGEANNVVSASYPGGEKSAYFTATALAPGDPARTALSGVVVDNAFTPIPGAVVSIAGSLVSATTDAQGRFRLMGVPPGHVHIHIDPSASPRTEVLPPLAFEAVMVAGAENTLRQPLSLPFLETASARVVGGDQDVDLTMPGVEGFKLKVFAHSVTFPDGSHEGVITVSQVQLDKVPMAPPNGTFFMPPAWTIQPHGVVFDPPAQITIPNDGLRPGRVIAIYQFDHELNQFINVGPGTTTDDASVITSDPGYGITRAGWGGCGQPPPPDTCATGCNDNNQCTDDSCQGNACRRIPVTGRACDDHRFCTNPDTCKDGQCTGDEKPDRTGDSGTLSLNIDQAIAPAKNFLRLLAGPNAPDFELNIGVTYGTVISCCDQTQSDVRNPMFSIQGAAGISGTFPTPWSVPVPGGEPQGLVIDLSLTASLSGSVTLNKCDNSASGQALGQLTFTVGGALQVGDPRIIKAALALTSGLTAAIVGDASPGMVDWDVDGGHLGLTVSVTFELANGIIELTGSSVLIEPSSISGHASTALTI